MSYQTYTTEAIVCGSSVSKTSDRSFLLFTRDAGMLLAVARSVREEKSKQRQALQDFSRVRVSLVKGKSGWRIGSVESHGNAFMDGSTREARAAITYLIKLVRRYVHGESALPNVFDDLTAALTCGNDTDPAVRDSAQLLFHIRLLAALGYVAHDPMLAPVFSLPFEEAVASRSDELLMRIDRAAKAASAASHL